MMNNKIYVAAPIKNALMNQKVTDKIITQTNFDVFLPQALNLKDSIDTINLIADRCYQEMDQSNIILVIAPYGLSTAAEIGYTVCLKRKEENIKLLMFNPHKHKLKLDAAIDPFLDEYFEILPDLIHYLKEIEYSTIGKLSTYASIYPN